MVGRKPVAQNKKLVTIRGGRPPKVEPPKKGKGKKYNRAKEKGRKSPGLSD